MFLCQHNTDNLIKNCKHKAEIYYLSEENFYSAILRLEVMIILMHRFVCMCVRARA